jgi:hypothetical protein
LVWLPFGSSEVDEAMFGNMSHPGFKCDGPQQTYDPNLLAASRLLQGTQEPARVDDSDRTHEHVAAHFVQNRPLFRNGGKRGPGDEGFSLSKEDLIWNNSCEGATHERAPLSWPNKLFGWNGE